ncbi:TPA: aminotransferase class I/II-fold pyridoxal phosphate-dependent enzyme, partial [Haemophilus influenzae]
MNNFYNFDVIIDRLNTFSAKWNIDNDIIPMSVADMDIPAPQIMIDELEKFNRLGIYGYTELPADYYKIISDYIFEQYHYSVLSEKIVFCPRIIQTVSIYIRAFTKETDGICILSPSYSPILNTIKLNDRKLYQCPLVYENRKYHIDFHLLEECFKHS